MKQLLELEVKINNELKSASKNENQADIGAKAESQAEDSSEKTAEIIEELDKPVTLTIDNSKVKPKIVEEFEEITLPPPVERNTHRQRGMLFGLRNDMASQKDLKSLVSPNVTPGMVKERVAMIEKNIEEQQKTTSIKKPR